MCITNWHGTDPSKEISLTKYGLLVRWDRRSKSFQCLYKVARNKWGLNNITPNQLDNILFEDWFEIENFQKYTDVPLGVWIKLSFEKKLQDLLQFVGGSEVFGLTNSYISSREACKVARVDYSPEYSLV